MNRRPVIVGIGESDAPLAPHLTDFGHHGDERMAPILGESEAAIDAAAANLGSDFEPLTDLRASAAYRLEAAANLLRRFYLEHNGTDQPLRTAAAATAG